MILLAIVRAFHLASLLTLFGAESFDALWRRRDSGIAVALPHRVLLGCAAFAFITAVLWLLAVAAQMGGQLIFPDRTTLTVVLGETFFGSVSLVRAAILLALIGTYVTATPSPIKIGLAGTALAMIALTSHAAAAGTPGNIDLRAAGDAIHLLAAGFWTGGLAIFARLVVVERANPGRLLAPLQAFSQSAAIAVASLVAAGSLDGYLVLFSGAGAWAAGYLTLLAAKLVLAAIMVALALTNRFGLVPALARSDTEARESLTISIFAELACALIIIVIIGFLGLMAPRT